MKRILYSLAAAACVAFISAPAEAQMLDLNARLRSQMPMQVGGQTRAAIRAQGIRGPTDLQRAQAAMMANQFQQPQSSVYANAPLVGQANSPQWTWTPATYGPWQYNPASPNAALRSSYFGSLRYEDGYSRNGYNPAAYNPLGYNPNGYNANNGYYNNGYYQPGSSGGATGVNGVMNSSAPANPNAPTNTNGTMSVPAGGTGAVPGR